jgi:hypothetical protein
VDPAEVAARYDKGVLEVSVPVEEVKLAGTRIPVENAENAENAETMPGEPAKPAKYEPAKPAK